jgi:hypothetical protein
MQPLVRLERIWGRSGGTLGGSSTQLNNAAGVVGSSGLSTGGEDRERRVFCQALRDGFVLCQCVSYFTVFRMPSMVLDTEYIEQPAIVGL